MSARVREARGDSIAFADKVFDVVVKIWKRSTDFVHVLLELIATIHDGSDRAAEDDVRRDEFVDSRCAPRIPELRVISADEGFVVGQGWNPSAHGAFPTRLKQRPKWVPAAQRNPKGAAGSEPTSSGNLAPPVPSSSFAILARMPAAPKKLFLVDAMAHVYRAFFAPMPQRLTRPGGLPTNIPFLFGNILKRLIKDYQPDYIGIVFDPPGATFRDKLFEKYKAQRQPMPDEMRVQLPFVRRLCEAMRLPVLEVKGYEADDVIGTMAVKAGKHNLEVLIVSNDKDMMQLVGKSVRTLRTGSGGAKGDIIVDEKKVEELLGVPPEKVVDYMALHEDTIDNIPGAKGIGEKGAAELIRKYGSVESALDHAAEVSNKRYREALQQQREQVLMSKQLATIATDAPIDVKPQELELRPPNGAALAELYRELGFNSLLKELGSEAVAPASSESAAQADYRQCASVAEFRKYVTELPRKEPLAIWLNLETGERESEGFGTHISSIEVSSKAGQGRSICFDEKGEALKALAPLLTDSKRLKIVHDPKLFQLLTGRAANIRYATQLLSYLLRPTTANHNFTDVVMRQFNVMLGGGPGERADYLQRLVPVLHEQVSEQKLDGVYEMIDLPLAPVL